MHAYNDFLLGVTTSNKEATYASLIMNFYCLKESLSIWIKLPNPFNKPSNNVQQFLALRCSMILNKTWPPNWGRICSVVNILRLLCQCRLGTSLLDSFIIIYENWPTWTWHCSYVEHDVQDFFAIRANFLDENDDEIEKACLISLKSPFLLGCSSYKLNLCNSFRLKLHNSSMCKIMQH